MSELIEKFIVIVVLFTVSLGVAAYATYFERKVAAWFQDRIGPDRAGPFGILQPLADGGKLFFKEDFIPASTQGEEKERRKRENKKIFDASIPRYNGTKNGGKDMTKKNKRREEEI